MFQRSWSIQSRNSQIEQGPGLEKEGELTIEKVYYGIEDEIGESLELRRESDGELLMVVDGEACALDRAQWIQLADALRKAADEERNP